MGKKAIEIRLDKRTQNGINLQGWYISKEYRRHNDKKAAREEEKNEFRKLWKNAQSTRKIWTTGWSREML